MKKIESSYSNIVIKGEKSVKGVFYVGEIVFSFVNSPWGISEFL